MPQAVVEKTKRSVTRLGCFFDPAIWLQKEAFLVGLIAAEQRLARGAEPAQATYSRQQRIEQKADKEARARAEKHEAKIASYVPHLPNPGKAEIHDDKLDGYGLNTEHPEGRSKAAKLDRAGFKTINHWERGNPESYRSVARSDSVYQASRNELKSQILSSLPQIPATPQHKPAFDSYYTKHTVVAPGIDPSKAAVVKSACDFEQAGQRTDFGRMVSIIPSSYSTDEEEGSNGNKKPSK